MNRMMSSPTLRLGLLIGGTALSVGACAPPQPVIYPHCAAAASTMRGELAEAAPAPLRCGQTPKPASTGGTGDAPGAMP